MKGGRFSFESKEKQKTSRTWLLAADDSRQLFEKDGESQEFEQARFADLLRLFQFASQTRTALPSGLPLGWLVRFVTPFRCGETSGKYTAVRVILSARFSRRKNGAPPRALPHNNVWQADHAPRDRARETRKKKDLKTRDELARRFGFRSFFRIACRNKPTKILVFGWVWEGLLTQKPSPNVSLFPPRHAKSPEGKCLPGRACERITQQPSSCSCPDAPWRLPRSS